MKKRTLLALKLILLLVLSSCSATRLYESGIKKINKAIQKDSGLALPGDTTRIVKVDTIRGVDGKDSIIHQIETVELPCDIDLDELREIASKKSRKELRFERKKYKDSLNHVRDMYKFELREVRRRLKADLKEQKLQLKETEARYKAEIKKLKVEKKNSPFYRFIGKLWWLLLLIGIILGNYLGRLFTIPKIFK